MMPVKLFYKSYGMNFHSYEKQIFIFFGFTKIPNDSKTQWTKRSQNELMQPTSSNSHSRSVFPYNFLNQAGFHNPFINGRSFIYLVIAKLSFTF